MNYSRFEHVDSDEDEPDTAAAAANERRKLEAAADAIPPLLREALGKMHIAADRGDAEGATHARNSLAQMIRELPDSERPKVMSAIQSVIVGTKAQAAAAAAAAATCTTKVPAGAAKQEQEKAPVHKQAPMMPKQTPTSKAQPEAAISASGDVEITGAGSIEDAREQLSQSLRELETAQKALCELEPGNTVRAQGFQPAPTAPPPAHHSYHRGLHY